MYGTRLLGTSIQQQFHSIYINSSRYLAMAAKTSKKASKTKVEEPSFPRTKECSYKFGAHVSTAGGVSNAILNASKIGANSFAMFLKSPRKWESPALKLEEIRLFRELCESHGYNPRTDILPHGSYFINLANPDDEKMEKSYDSFLDDLRRCESLDIGLYNFHPGSSLDGDHKAALSKLAKNINKAISETKFVKIVIENMAGHGNLIGSDLQDIRDVIDMIDDKNRVGVCIDTCHTFAAGYDIVSKEKFEEFWENYERIIGYEYLSAIHLNDSKAPLGANRDLHQKLGLGFVGLECFRLIANFDRLQNIPIVLETPQDEVKKGGDGEMLYGREIKLLEWLIGKEQDDEEFITRSTELSKDGEAERKEQLGKFDAKKEKAGKEKKRTLGNDIGSLLSKKKTRAK
ncbi:apurinic-apyrimidinic endonuclease 1 [[Candida] railenensis]|uniref:Apurinic-apyrimidinic endonuclease 1 n=1 Tax=[Candida] railenensis TaxID=45579 RepID=A0A9P0VWC1_9ASCO|nr:apurinic-apyrimidinic endonuclease 1 [[Candida] railenensis]